MRPRADAREPVTLAVLALGGILFSVTQTMVLPLLPVLLVSTRATGQQLSWLVTGPLLVGAVVTPILGRLADQRGKRTVLATVFVVMAAGSFLLAATSEVAVMIAARCLQGVAAAFVPIAISLLRDVLPGPRFVRGVGLLSASLGIGAASGVPVAAAVAHSTDWHVVFLGTGVLAVLVIVLLLGVLPPGGARTGGRFDAVGAVGLAIALTALMLAITEGSGWGWLSLPTSAAVGVAVLVCTAWVAHQLRVEDPVVDVRLASRRSVVLANTLAFLIGFAFFGNTLVTTQLVQAPRAVGGYGLDLLHAGLLQIPAGLSVFVFSLASSRITGQFGPRATMLIAAPLLVVGYLLHMLAPGLSGVIAGLTVVSAGTAVAYAALPVLLVGHVPVSSMASANGINVLLRTIGQTSCSAVVAAVLASRQTRVGGEWWPTALSFDLSYVGATVASVLVLLLASFLPRGGGTRLSRRYRL